MSAMNNFKFPYFVELLVAHTVRNWVYPRQKDHKATLLSSET